MPTISEAQIQEVRQEIDQMSLAQARIALRLIFEDLAKNLSLFYLYHRHLESAFHLSP